MRKRQRKNIKIAIGGYYGFGSIGDEAVLTSIVHNISKIIPQCIITVFNAKKMTPRKVNNCTVSYVSRTSVFSILKTLILSDIFISGGGSLLQDSTSTQSLFYYTSMIRAAKLFGCKVYIMSNGLGPLKNKRLAAKALSLADRVSLRDPVSFTLAKCLSKKNQNVHLGADPVFSYPFNENKKTFLACLSLLEGKKFFAVSLRNFASNTTFDKEGVLQTIRELTDDGSVPVYVSMQNSFDLEISREFAKKTGGIIADICDEDDLFALLKKAEFAFGMRLHFLLTALIAGTPVLAISYDCKVENCLRYMGVDHVVSLEETTADILLNGLYRAKNSFPEKNVMQSVDTMKDLSLSDMEAILSIPLSAKDKNAKKRRAPKQVSS